MSDIRFSVVPYETCVEEVVAFRNANRELVRDLRYFEWRYQRRPCREKAMIVWGTDSQGRKLAAASVIPHDFYVMDGVYPVGLLGDISVAPEARGRGVATQMLRFLRQDPAMQALRACLVLPNDEATGSLERAGWRQVTSIARLVKIVDAGPRCRAWLGNNRPVNAFSRAINSLSRFTSLDGWQPRHGPCRAVAGDVFDRGFDELWNEIPKHGRVLALRDRSHLQWRYQAHPTVRYRKIELRLEDRLRGYVVFHVADNVVVVDDFLAGDATVGARLIGEFLDHVRRERLAADIHVRYSTGSFLGMPWGRFGFFRRRDFQRVMVSLPQGDRYPLFPSGEDMWFVTAGDKDV